MDEQLIFDVGAHRGEDTRYYLAKGFRVVAVEAHPDLAARLRSEFSAEVASGQLQVAECAVAETAGTVEFFVNDKISEWGTIRSNWADRNSKLRAGSRAIVVESVTFGELLDRYGIPYYLKVDIEGADLLCLEGLLDRDDRPAYISIESEKRSWKALVAEFDLFERLGFDRFQVVDQMTIEGQEHPAVAREGRTVGTKSGYGSSGLFGRDLPQNWLDRSGALARYKKIFRVYRVIGDDTVLRFIARRIPFLGRHCVAHWYDTHASRPIAPAQAPRTHVQKANPLPEPVGAALVG